jgi:tetratricopeptide (TPR) repeat protein
MAGKNRDRASDDAPLGTPGAVGRATIPPASDPSREGSATVIDTRMAIAGVTEGQLGAPATHAPEIDRAQFEAEATRRANIMLGDHYMSGAMGGVMHPEAACDAYKAAGATEKLIAVGERFLRAGVLRTGLDAFSAAAANAPAETLIVCGDRCLDKGEFGDACTAYEAAGATERLVTLGDHRLEIGDLYTGTTAYAAAGREVPKEKLVACADHCLETQRVDTAVMAYVAAGVEVPKERLNALADRWLEDGAASYLVVPAYREAGRSDKLITLGDRWLEEGDVSSARMAYREAEAMDKVIGIGDRLFDEKDYEGALNAYRESGALWKISRGRLREIGDHLLRGGRTHAAIQAYEAMSDTEMLLLLAKRWLDRNERRDAMEAFSAVARIQLRVEHVLGGPVRDR